MEYQHLTIHRGAGTATITFNRPAALNAMNTETMQELASALASCRADEAVRVIILTGSGDKAFIAGADIEEMKNMPAVDALTFLELGHRTLRALETMEKPVIAAVNGLALGGGAEITLACDIRFASDRARFGVPEVSIGLIPGWGGTQRLPRLVGMGRAKELILSGDMIDAARAYEIGLVNRVIPHEKLMAETTAFAEKLAARPAFAVKMAKQSINYGFDLSLDNAIQLEAQCCAQCFSTQDQKEGMTAFLEKRPPRYVGR